MSTFNPDNEAEGLGDIIAKITHKLGIAKIAEDLASNQIRRSVNQRKIKM